MAAVELKEHLQKKNSEECLKKTNCYWFKYTDKNGNKKGECMSRCRGCYYITNIYNGNYRKLKNKGKHFPKVLEKENLYIVKESFVTGGRFKSNSICDS